ncbi:LAQU0S03e01200g1_1 [Lachancea quebecensis]|uniref:LAQU0S03e01200g1_1 n=1 Tax=Lachancea quebecensis TaxID=1654605 RepID=A0A0P1KWT2_9SACH|nr:LAQU0S03e01200g1_1 [Lachancea quebecensis]
MERLNSLEKSLPPERPATDQAIDKLNQQVTQEFKIAANAVTSLYRLSSERSSLSRHAGYAECLDDVLQQLEGGRTAEELRQWCEERKREIRGSTATKTELGAPIVADRTPTMPSGPSSDVCGPLSSFASRDRRAKPNRSATAQTDPERKIKKPRNWNNRPAP